MTLRGSGSSGATLTHDPLPVRVVSAGEGVTLFREVNMVIELTVKEVELLKSVVAGTIRVASLQKDEQLVGMLGGIQAKLYAT